jgi:hypothetical protein
VKALTLTDASDQDVKQAFQIVLQDGKVKGVQVDQIAQSRD